MNDLAALLDAVESLVSCLRERARTDRRLAADDELSELAVVALHRAQVLRVRTVASESVLIELAQETLRELDVAMNLLGSSDAYARDRALDPSPSG